jgi:CRP-like cAMP-binding protein
MVCESYSQGRAGLRQQAELDQNAGMSDRHQTDAAAMARVGAGDRTSAGVALSVQLTDEHIALLRRTGKVRPTRTGDVLFREGDAGYDLIVIMAGAVTIVDHQAGVERELDSGGPGEFIAELNLLTGERLFTTAVVSAPGEVLVVPRGDLQALISQNQAFGQLIVQTMFARREWLAERKTGLRIVGSRHQLTPVPSLSSPSAIVSRTSGWTRTPIRPLTLSLPATR